MKKILIECEVPDDFPVENSTIDIEFDGTLEQRYYLTQGKILSPIEAKALRKKGTDKWYNFLGGWGEFDVPVIREDWQDKSTERLKEWFDKPTWLDHSIHPLPSDAELITIKIIVE